MEGALEKDWGIQESTAGLQSRQTAGASHHKRHPIVTARVEQK